MRICVLTTSYPRDADDVAGVFVADTVTALRAAGNEVEVVSPATFRHFGIAYGDGIVQNLRRRPLLLLAVPFFLMNFARAARRAAQGADVVHAHWLPSVIPGLATRRPLVVQVWGTDLELARHAPFLARLLIRRARVVVAASTFLADAARKYGAREVVVVPTGVRIPEGVADPAEPAHVLFVGRLSAEKGIEEFLAATDGLPRVIVGDGPLRDRVPESVGFVPPSELGPYFERASVVCVPSRREGYGMVAREALAHGRPLVTTGVGGLADLAGDGVTFVPVADRDALRRAIESLLGDRQTARTFGAKARQRAEAELSVTRELATLTEAYRLAAAPPSRRG